MSDKENEEYLNKFNKRLKKLQDRLRNGLTVEEKKAFKELGKEFEREFPPKRIKDINVRVCAENQYINETIEVVKKISDSEFYRPIIKEISLMVSPVALEMKNGNFVANESFCSCQSFPIEDKYHLLMGVHPEAMGSNGFKGSISHEILEFLYVESDEFLNDMSKKFQNPLTDPIEWNLYRFLIDEAVDERVYRLDRKWCTDMKKNDFENFKKYIVPQAKRTFEEIKGVPYFFICMSPGNYLPILKHGNKCGKKLKNDTLNEVKGVGSKVYESVKSYSDWIECYPLYTLTKDLYEQALVGLSLTTG